MANHIEVLKALRAQLAALAAQYVDSASRGVTERRDELLAQVAAIDVVLVDAARFGDLREILVSLNEPNVMGTLGGLIESAADEVAARHPEPTIEAINELADVIIKTAREHADS